MPSRSAACVFGEARFTSSTRRRFANTGPGLKSNAFVRWSKTLTPGTSDGSRAGVNWSREKVQSSDRASTFASIVFPTPGKSSMIRCPSATRQRTHSRSVSSDACTTRPRFSTIAAIVRGASPVFSRSASLTKQHLRSIYDRSGNLVFRRLVESALAVARDDDDLVVGRVEPDVAPRHVVEDDQVDRLAQ